jgi:tetratricopeptide (TPR) repeat protein
MTSGESTPDTALTMMAIAEARLFQGDSAGAEPILRQALEILKGKLPPQYPSVTAAEIRLGEALTAAGKAAAAEPVLRRALASAYAPPFKVPGWQVGEAESALGWCLVALGHTEEAHRLLKQSQRKLITDPRPAYRKQAAMHFEKVLYEWHKRHKS